MILPTRASSVPTANSKQKKGIKQSIGRLFGKKKEGGVRLEPTVGRDGQALPALTGLPLLGKPLTHSKSGGSHCLRCLLDFEMGIGDTMTLGKLGTQAERDRRMKKK